VNLVPVAVNLSKIRRDPTTGDWFRSIQRQQDQYQGIWIVSAEGKVLAPDHSFRRWAPTATAREIFDIQKRDMLEMAQASLKAFGPVKPRQVKPREQLPYRGVGVKPDGKVDLTVYRRKLHQGKSDGPVLRDTIPLGKEEWAALAAPRPAAGAEWVIPGAVARKMVRALCTNTFGTPEALPGPEDAKVAELRATVEAVQDGRARIRFTGTLEAIKELKDEPQRSYRGVASATGMAVYDVKDKRMTSLLLYLQGTSESWPKAKGKHDLGAVIEWQWERASPR
jgi:hypothetical protein